MLRSLYKDMISTFEKAGVDTPDLDARYIIEERAGLNWSDIIAYPEKELSDQQIELIQKDIAERLSGKPVSRIYGQREFWGLPFKVSKDTLDPRPDTETIIDVALQRFEKNTPIRILDMGTGTGCILIALLSEFPNASGVGADLSGQALKVARHNANANVVDSRISFVQGSWFEPVEGVFDLIVSNPPYIRSDVIPELSPEVKNHDPILALDGGETGLAPYEIIFSDIKKFLKAGGIGLFEIGYDQKDDVMRLAEESSFPQRSVHIDMAGNPRVVEISCGDK